MTKAMAMAGIGMASCMFIGVWGYTLLQGGIEGWIFPSLSPLIGWLSIGIGVLGTPTFASLFHLEDTARETKKGVKNETDKGC